MAWTAPIKTCPSCRQADAYASSYPGEAKQGCLRDKRRRDEPNAQLKGVTAKELREQIKARGREMDKR